MEDIFAGETGQLWRYSYNIFNNALGILRLGKQVSRLLQEKTGAPQGHKRSPPFFCNYYNPVLRIIKSALLETIVFLSNCIRILCADEAIGATWSNQVV